MTEIVDLPTAAHPSSMPATPTVRSRPTARRSGRRASAVLLAVAVVALASCSAGGDDDVAEVTSGTVVVDRTGGTAGGDAGPEGERGPGGVLRLTATLSGEAPASNPMCEPGPGKQVKDHDDLDIQEEILEGLHEEAFELPDGRTMPAIDVPEIVIPAHTVDGGCTVTFDAPAGCLPKVAISGTAIPTIEVPGYTFERLDRSADRVRTVTVPKLVLEGVSVDDQIAEQTCAIDDGAVTRPSINRPVLKRNSGSRSREYFSVSCTEDVGCPEPVSIPSGFISQAMLFSVKVDAETLEVEDLGDSGAQVVDDGDRTSYIAPASVLFDTGEWELKPAASASLEQILTEVEKASTNKKITIDGHTDDVGSDADNEALSERRAEAVAAWLTGKGIDRSRISTKGFGESVPAAPNDSEAGRAQNRRVVISVVD